MQEESAQAVAAVTEAAPQIATAVDAIVARLRGGGRLVYAGAGTAGRMGVLDASEIPPTFGTDPSLVVGIIAGGDVALRSAVEDAEDEAARGAADLEAIGLAPGDALVGISASGRTPYVLGGIEYAVASARSAVGFACNADSAIGAAADLAIETVVGPEIVAGSTTTQGGHRAEARAQRHLDDRDGAARQGARQPHGRRARHERQAPCPRRAHRHAGDRRRCRRGVDGPRVGRRLGQGVRSSSP